MSDLTAPTTRLPVTPIHSDGPFPINCNEPASATTLRLSLAYWIIELSRLFVRRTGAFMKLVGAIVLLVLSPLGVGTAYADSDGYYCIGRGYLAYQFGFAAPSTRPHRLSVVRFLGTSGIQPPAVLDLPQFQVHGMQCGEGWIDVASFTAIYRVTLDESDRPVRYAVQAFPDGQKIPQEFILSQVQNLGAESGGRAYLKPVRVRLTAKERGGAYLLEIIARAIPPLEKCELRITSRLVETNRGGREVNARVIFQGLGHRECGE